MDIFTLSKLRTQIVYMYDATLLHKMGARSSKNAENTNPRTQTFIEDKEQSPSVETPSKLKTASQKSPSSQSASSPQNASSSQNTPSPPETTSSPENAHAPEENAQNADSVTINVEDLRNEFKQFQALIQSELARNTKMNEETLQHNQELNQNLIYLLDNLAGQQPVDNDSNTAPQPEYNDQYAQSAQQSTDTQLNNNAQLSPLSSPVSSNSSSPSTSPRQSPAKR